MKADKIVGVLFMIIVAALLLALYEGLDDQMSKEPVCVQVK